MKDIVWVFKVFGFKAGFQYVWDTIRRPFMRFHKPFPIKFEDLTDEQAEKVAHSFGLYQWDDREDLNRLWNEFNKYLN